MNDRASELTAEIARQVGTTVPGLAVAVVTADDTLLMEGRGTADLATGRSMTPATLCNWFSMTKLVTATVAMQLADEGRLDLDEPIVDHHKRLATLRPRERAEAMTARHLLSHSSGLANPLPTRWVHLASKAGPDRSLFVDMLLDRHRRLRFDPGTKASYSNLGYLLLGEVIETASGCTYEECVTDKVLRPLGMTSTGFTAAPSQIWATPYQRRRTALNVVLPALVPREIIGPSIGRFRSLKQFYVDGAPYGGLVGPATDAARFARAHLGDGCLDGVEVLSPASARAMRTTSATGPKLETGLGWYRRGADPDPGIVEHLGGGAGFWTCMRLYPERGIGVVTMGNASAYDHDALVTAATTSASHT